MQKKDIKIGERYAYSRGNWGFDHFEADEVEVTGTTTIQKGGGYYGSHNRTVPAYVIKVIGTGRVLNVESRSIREPWDQYSERKRKNDVRKKEIQDERVSRKIREFETLLRADTIIRRLYPERQVQARPLFTGSEREAAATAGWTVDQDGKIHTVLKYALHGEITLDDVALLVDTLTGAREVWATRNLDRDEIYEHDSEKTARYYGEKRGSEVLMALRTPWREVL